MKPRFLIDENLSREIAAGVRRHDSSIVILHVGDPGAPPVRALDPAVLEYCEREHRILVTKNRKSMPGHIADHIRAGRQFWGSLSVKKGRENDIGGLIESLVLVWEIQDAEEYVGMRDWIPF